MKTRTDLLNLIIEKMNYDTYLEVGIYEGENYNKIKAPVKVGVDPNCGIDGIRREFSNDFFNKNKDKFDIIFIDGDHNYEQVKQDVDNALKHLTRWGMVVMHDTCPPTLGHSGRYREGEWCGDAYKVAIECNNSDKAEVYTWNKDFGVTIIMPGEGSTINEYGLTYSDLTKNNFQAVNSQPIGVLTAMLESFSVLRRNIEDDEALDRVELDHEEVQTLDIEEIDIKEYYKLCFPDRRIGRKKEETLIKELKDGGFEV